MISQVDPILRLNALKEYMAFWIDKYPDCYWSFERFLFSRYPKIIPGSPEHARSIATHCFYCGRIFKKEGKQIATIDHFMPQSIGETEKYVICCQHCNAYKGNTSPKEFVKKVTIAELRGWQLFGFSGKTLKHVFTQAHKIINDLHYNIGPQVYFIKK